MDKKIRTSHIEKPEKRVFSRHVADFGLWVQAKHDQEAHLADIVNVSAGGILFKTPFSYKVGQQLTCSLEIHARDLFLEIAGVICRVQLTSNPPQYAFKIESISDMGLKQFESILAGLFQ